MVAANFERSQGECVAMEQSNPNDLKNLPKQGQKINVPEGFSQI